MYQGVCIYPFLSGKWCQMPVVFHKEKKESMIQIKQNGEKIEEQRRTKTENMIGMITSQNSLKQPTTFAL